MILAFWPRMTFLKKKAWKQAPTFKWTSHLLGTIFSHQILKAGFPHLFNYRSIALISSENYYGINLIGIHRFFLNILNLFYFHNTSIVGVIYLLSSVRRYVDMYKKLCTQLLNHWMELNLILTCLNIPQSV